MDIYAAGGRGELSSQAVSVPHHHIDTISMSFKTGKEESREHSLDFCGIEGTYSFSSVRKWMHKGIQIAGYRG